MKKRYKASIGIGFIMLLIVVAMLTYPVLTTTKAIAANTAVFKFEDHQTSCPINGDVYINKVLIGRTTDGVLELKGEDYSANFNQPSVLSLAGSTEKCFGESQNLPIYEEWDLSNLQYYIDNSAEVIFEAQVVPRQPRYYEEMQRFITPDEVKEQLSKIKLNPEDNLEKNLDRIAKYRISYVSDKTLFDSYEYWQTPVETLSNGMGDCEDWATTTLSLMRAYQPELQCYNIVWESHISIFCYYDGAYYIYDQGRTKSKTSLNTKESELDQKIQLREMRNDYFDEYGLKPSERKVYAVFNEAEVVEFNQPEDFIDWMLSLSK